MGGGSGGSYPTLDIEAITKAANKRIQAAFSADKVILFICHSADSDDLQDKIRNSKTLRDKRLDISIPKDGRLEEKIEAASLIVYYIRKSEDHSYIDEAVRLSVKHRRESICVRGEQRGSIPPYVIQYRINIVSWESFLEIVA